MKLLLDTNFMIDCIRFRLDFFEHLSRLEDDEGKIEIFIPNFCIDETRKIKDAKLALQLLKNTRISMIDIERCGSIDNSILCYAKEHGYAVATNDKKFLDELSRNHIRAIRIKQRKYFDVY